MINFSDLKVPQEEVSGLLAGIGIHLDTQLAPAFVLAGTDLLIAANLAKTLPHGADFLGAVSELHTFKVSLPEPVLLVLQALYQELIDESSGLEKTRLKELAAHVEMIDELSPKK